jgi:hypothetical protein
VAVNNPPTPVVALADPAWPPGVNCDQLIGQFAPPGTPPRPSPPNPPQPPPIWTGPHSQNQNFPNPPYQSHHVFQNALCINSVGNRLVSYGAGFAAMLHGGSTMPGTEHNIANAWQAYRRRADTKAATPPPYYWPDMTRWAKNDLYQAFTNGNPQRPGMTPQIAEQLADCLVMQAEDQIAEAREAAGLRPYRPGPTNRVGTPGGCFTMDVLVWMSPSVAVPAEHLGIGDLIETSEGSLSITRVDVCFTELIDDEAIAVSASHRIRLTDGRYLAAHCVRAGHRVATRTGDVRVASVTPRGAAERVLSVGFRRPGDCYLGRSGVAVEATHGAPPVVALGTWED